MTIFLTHAFANVGMLDYEHETMLNVASSERLLTFVPGQPRGPQIDAYMRRLRVLLVQHLKLKKHFTNYAIEKFFILLHASLVVEMLLEVADNNESENFEFIFTRIKKMY